MKRKFYVSANFSGVGGTGSAWVIADVEGPVTFEKIKELEEQMKLETKKNPTWVQLTGMIEIEEAK